MPYAKPSKLKLSAEKQAQLKRHKKLTGKPIRFPVAIERRYVRELEKLTKAMVRETEKIIKAALAPYAADESLQEKADRLHKEAQEAQAVAVKALADYRIEKLKQKFDALFARTANEVASKMVMDTNKASVVHLTGTLRELSGQMTLKMDFMNKPIGKEIRAALYENTKLIRSIPDAYMERVQKTLHQAAVRGGDMTGLAKKIEQQGGISERRAKNIALDQTRKTFATINQHRMKAVGVKQFEWVHSGGGANPREFHMTPFPAGLDGGIFDMDDPPVIDEETGETGFPADLPNCKCVMAPVISFDEFDDENWTEPDEE